MARPLDRARLFGVAVALLLTTAGCTTMAPRSRRAADTATVLAGLPSREYGTERCGAGSLSSVLTYHGTEVSVAELDAGLPRTDEGRVLSIDLLLAARTHGYEARWVAGDPAHLADVIEAGLPAILMLRLLDRPGTDSDLYHYVVVDGVDARRRLFRLHFGDGRARWSPFGRRLTRAWDGAGQAMLIVRPAPADPAEALRAAFALELDGRLGEAAAAYRALLDREPGLYRAWVNLGNVSTRLDRHDEAESAYRHALGLAPDQPDAMNNLAWLLVARGLRLDEAEQLARSAAAQGGPQLPFVLDTLGRVLLARGRCGEAAGTFRHALHRIDGEATSVRIVLLQGLAESHRRCGDLRGARGFLEEALTIDPDARATAEIRRELAALHTAEIDSRR